MNELINDIASLVLVASLILLIIGLIRPTALTRKKSTKVFSRKQISLFLSGVILVCMVIIGINSPAQGNSNTAAQATQVGSVQKHKNNTPAPKAPATSTAPASTSATPTTTTAPNNKAGVITQMNTIQTDLSDAWSSCQSDTSSCQAKVVAIPDYQKLYDSNSSNFSGKASDGFSSWRIDISTAEGDMKQWAINKAFDRPSDSLTADMVSQEVQNVQGDINGFGND